jgi:hypothetical protein
MQDVIIPVGLLSFYYLRDISFYEKNINFNSRRQNLNVTRLPRTPSCFAGLKLQQLASWVHGYTLLSGDGLMNILTHGGKK